jgi:hypothetical protein
VLWFVLLLLFIAIVAPKAFFFVLIVGLLFWLFSGAGSNSRRR